MMTMTKIPLKVRTNTLRNAAQLLLGMTANTPTSNVQIENSVVKLLMITTATKEK